LEADDVVLSVQDTGPGIAPEKLSQVFVEHVRLDAEYVPDGLGLGLPIVRRASSLLSHDVQLQSRLGEGTTAVLRMQAAASSPSSAVPSVDAAIGTNKSVMVVEDDQESREALQGLLRRWGFVVIDDPNNAAPSTSSAGQKPAVPDLVISDLHMGQWNGLQWIREFRSRVSRPDLPALLLTGDLDQAVAARAAAEGVQLAHKPLLPARLHAKLTAMLAGPDR
jgi:CheY-like chemotaxis protein